MDPVGWVGQWFDAVVDWILAAMAVAMAVLSGVLAVGMAEDTSALRAHSVVAVAEVIEVREDWRTSSAMVRFTTSGGEVVEVSMGASGTGRSGKDLRLGDDLEVLYDPADPTNAVGAHGGPSRIGAIMMWVFAAFFLVIAGEMLFGWYDASLRRLIGADPDTDLGPHPYQVRRVARRRAAARALRRRKTTDDDR